MSRKRTLPGVDEKALASLAHMFPAAGAADAIKVAHPSPPPNGTTKTAAPIVVPDEALPTQSADRPVDSTPLVETRSAPEVHAEPALQNDDDTAEDIVPPPPSSATARLAFAMALVALVIAAFSAASPSALQRLSDTLGPSFVVDFLTGRRASLDAQIAANADSIREIETQLSAARAQEDAVRAAGSRLGAVEQREAATASALQDAEARIAAAETLAQAAAEKVATLDATLSRALDELASRVAAGGRADRDSERFYLAAIQLRTALQGSGGYARELALVARVAGPDPALREPLATLASHAEAGVPNFADLRAAFAKNIAARLPPAAPAGAPSLANRGIALVRSILPPGQPARGDTSEQRNAIAVGMAERSLADGQLALAVDQLLLLEDRGALIAAEWLRDATARLAADRAIGMVVAQAFDRLATAP